MQCNVPGADFQTLESNLLRLDIVRHCSYEFTVFSAYLNKCCPQAVDASGLEERLTTLRPRPLLFTVS